MTPAQAVGAAGLILLVGGVLASVAIMIAVDDGVWAGVGFLAAVLGFTGLVLLLAGMATGAIR